MHVHGDPVRVRMGILRACVGTWCVHAWGSCMRAFVRGDPVRARMVILRACVRVWGPSACTHGDRACVGLVHACAGSSMHSGDLMRACVRAGIRYGCEDPAGTGRRPVTGVDPITIRQSLIPSSLRPLSSQDEVECEGEET